MLATGPDLLIEARAAGRAIPALTTYTLESTRAICDAAQRTGLPVIVSAGSSSFRAVGRQLLAAGALAEARSASVPIGVHLDHSTDFEEIRACIALGYSSVMIDGSELPFEDNVALTRAVVDEAHRASVWVEGELGGVTGNEDASSNSVSGELTDPDQVQEFIALTGIDALAPAVGTVHGFTSRPVSIDLQRLRAIADVTDIPLVLHGASGLTDSDVIAVVNAGVAKVNINAELRRAYLAALDAGLASGGDDLPGLQTRAIAAMTDIAIDKLLLLSRSDAVHVSEERS